MKKNFAPNIPRPLLMRPSPHEADDDTWGANNWVKHNETIIENIDKALAIDEDTQPPSNELIPVNVSGPAIGEPL